MKYGLTLVERKKRDSGKVATLRRALIDSSHSIMMKNVCCNMQLGLLARVAVSHLQQNLIKTSNIQKTTPFGLNCTDSSPVIVIYHSTLKVMTSFFSSEFEWINSPVRWHKEIESTADHKSGDIEGGGGSFDISATVLKIKPAAYKDFWSKTFYSPTLIKSDACGYLYPIRAEDEATIKIDFSYTPVMQFDQAGLLLYIDEDHWVKCGIEFCDGHPRLSVVVCNVYSDWSTQPWPSCAARLKVHKVNQGSSIVVEAADVNSENYQFVRIAHITSTNCDPSVAELPPWRIGPFAACPTKQRGCEATFQNFSVGSRERPVHDPDLHSHDA